MRNDQEFLAEIYSREAKYKSRKKRIVKATLLSVIPMFVCTAVVLSLVFGSSFVSSKNSAPTADRETHLYTGDYEEITDVADDAEGEVAEDTVADETDNGTAEIVTSQSAESIDETFDGALEKPAVTSDSDKKSQDNLSVNSAAGAPLQGQTAQNSLNSKAPQTANKSEAVSSETTKQDATVQQSMVTNDGRLEASDRDKELLRKWKPVIDAKSFTIVYDSKETCISNETAVDKMETLIADPYHKVVDFSDNSPEILTIEMGGMKFVLKSKTLQNVTLDENYLLSELFMKAFKYGLAENNLLTDDLTRELDKIIDSFDEAVGYVLELTKSKAGTSVVGKEVDKEFSEANTKFYLELLKNLNTENENVLISPLSIVNALGMTANGAKGKTLTEMQNVIAGGMDINTFNQYVKDYSGLHRSKSINLANSIWIKNDDSIVAKDNFLNKCKGVYKAQVFKSDFDAFGVNQINNWISQYTNEKINKIIDKFKSNDAMVLVNATYFADTWMSMFDPQYDVEVKKFTNFNGKSVNVNMMHDREYDYLSGENCTGFLKEYRHGYSFAALLPKKGMGTEEFLNSLTASELQTILTTPESVAVDLAMPKFKVEYKASLSGVLKKMGMKTPFSSSAANFGNMAKSNDNLYIGDVVHQTTIDLNEKGTVASAVTSVNIAAAGMPDEIKEVNLNRPFVYFIIDNTTNLPIFCGTVNNLPSVK